ncbi:MAG: hypothetical protein ACOCXH_01420 [Cyclobacteriaceae bacterium]
MKKKLFALLFGGFILMASCVQYTCPTYTKDTLEKKEKVDQQKRS